MIEGDFQTKSFYITICCYFNCLLLIQSLSLEQMMYRASLYSFLPDRALLLYSASYDVNKKHVTFT